MEKVFYTLFNMRINIWQSDIFPRIKRSVLTSPWGPSCPTFKAWAGNLLGMTTRFPRKILASGHTVSSSRSLNKACNSSMLFSMVISSRFSREVQLFACTN